MNWSGIAPTGGAARPMRPRRSAALTESFDATVPITRLGGGRGGTSVGRSGAAPHDVERRRRAARARVGGVAACVEEALRLAPTVGFVVARIVGERRASVRRRAARVLVPAQREAAHLGGERRAPRARRRGRFAATRDSACIPACRKWRSVRHLIETSDVAGCGLGRAVSPDPRPAALRVDTTGVRERASRAWKVCAKSRDGTGDGRRASYPVQAFALFEDESLLFPSETLYPFSRTF